MAGKWIKLEQKGTGPGARSSHAVSLVGEKAYVFGGEFTPRVPVDNFMHVFDLEQRTWAILDVTGDVPPPRVGVTMASIGSTIYVFGGRDQEHKELNELYSFDTITNKWSLLSSGDMSPPHRSFHSMAADDSCIYIFGGCGNADRLKDLWAFDTTARNWIMFPLPGETCPPRGGPGLAVCGGKIWVVCGFSGVELNDVHSFDPVTQNWTLVETSGDKPSPRSVFSTACIGKYIYIYGGEVDPSDLGHLGAGKFAQEVYALDADTHVWERLKEEAESGEHPGPRGWCAFSAGTMDGKDGLLVLGGNSPTNDRLGDIFFFVPGLQKT